MNSPFHFLDLSIIVLYLAGVVALGLIRSKKQSPSDDDYLLSGRRLTLIPFTASLVATWYGGILGVGEFTYRYGISNWVVFGLPYYLFALLFAFLLAGKIRQSQITTIPDRFRDKYGAEAGIVSAVLVMILTSPAPYIFSTGIILKLIFNIDSNVALLLAAALSLVYIFSGGFRSVIRTDLLQFFLMFAGFAVIVILAATQYGGFSMLKEKLPQLHLTWKGGHTSQYITVWFFIAMWTFVDPGFYQRCAAADSPAVAKRGILTAIIFWALFDFLTLTTGLYARAILADNADPAMALPQLGMEILPPVLLGIFFIAILSTIMSTTDSFGFICATTLGRDIIWRLKGETDSPVKLTKVGLLITAIISLLLAWLLPSVVSLWYVIGTVCVPGLLVPLLITFWADGRFVIRGVTWMMTISATVSFAWLLAGTLQGADSPAYPLDIEPFYPGFAVSLLWSIVSGKRK
ncbi:MAG: sodium:solute symporter family protein [Candidatus Marinimicrobia bacterium]|nr:sodium:solute symporter family protein [Candidatus Neomarinimicrobiota bacterium]MDP6593801.1 sodium:solute symporter family protein [Candidatus Neomarinimicrobiota bacterium]MDP6837145.1 sodium:solute symporter family protein [Candidatus Neomarinimicrobiota bacterium]MDP6966834.1 sodium:solute symporter family protein [Candidatus Neomarinimicrobiota bacterium]